MIFISKHPIVAVAFSVALVIGCNRQSEVEGPVAVVVEIDLSSDGLFVDGRHIDIGELGAVLESEVKQHPTFATIAIDSDTPMIQVTELFKEIRSSNIWGVHYKTDKKRQEFYSPSV